MKFLEKRIGRIIDIIFCLVFIPIIFVLGSMGYWIDYSPEFTYLLIAWLYVSYFIIRLFNIPKLFIERKYVFIALIIGVLICCDYILTLYRLPEVTFNASSLTELYHRIQASSLSQTVWLMCSLVMGYAVSMSFIQELYHQLLLKKEVEFQKNNAQLAVYKAQINPHFLFNTLNSIYSLIIGTSEKAEDAFIKFIDIVKYTYTGVGHDKVALKEEIAYINNYIDLQKLRLNHHTSVNWRCDVDDENAQIPPMIMITFLENVFKYGISANKDCSVSIELTMKDGLLEFRTENRVMKRRGESRYQPVGIENCRARLDSLFPGCYVLTADENDGLFNVYMKIQLS